MSPIVWIVIAVVVIAVIAAVIAASAKKRKGRREGLRDNFGPEYDRTVEQSDSRREAEKELAAREERHDQFEIRPLEDSDRTRFQERWGEVQHDFVDAPAPTLHRADALIQEVMRARGYPVDDFDQRAADLSVQHPNVVEHYRAGHAATVSEGGQTTESRREAMLHYRALFDELVGSSAAPITASTETTTSGTATPPPTTPDGAQTTSTTPPDQPAPPPPQDPPPPAR